MSTETTTATPKTSFLTRVAEIAAAKKAEKVSDENVVPTSEEVRAKRALKKFGLVLVGTLAATTAVIVIANRMDRDESSSEVEETPSED